MLIRRGELYWAHLDPTKGSEQAGRRPVLVIQNDYGNSFSPTVIVAPLTTKGAPSNFPVHVDIPKGVAGLSVHSTILLSQIRTIDKSRLAKKIGSLPPAHINRVYQAIKISLGLLPHVNA